MADKNGKTYEIMKKNNYIFDTNFFDSIIDNKVNINLLIKFKNNGAKFHITHIQIDQVNECDNKNKRAILNLFMVKIAPQVLPTETFIIGRSRLGEAKLGKAEIFKKLQVNNKKHTDDALIGEVAIKNSLILVTNDKTLLSRVNSNGGKAINFEEFIKANEK